MTSEPTNFETIELAESWFAEIRSNEKPEEDDDSFGGKVTEMSFFAPEETQWEFLLIATEMAENEDEFGYVAAFSFEQFMSTYGPQYIDEIERLSATNQKLRCVVMRSWRRLIDRKTWRRIQKIQGVELPFWKLW